MRQKIINIPKNLLKLESFPGILLLFATLLALVVANNSTTGHAYHEILHLNFASLSIHEWVNDVLMAIFFLGIGLEIKKEVLMGNLASIKSAAFPVIAALGGMVVPALIYIAFTQNTPYVHGFGIPMATDIAFALGVLMLLGKRVPIELKIFLLTLAVVDDLGAIVIIALFYSKGIVVANLFFALGILVVLFILNKLGVRAIFFYLLGGLFLWYFVFNSGVHATIAGVLLAFTIPLKTEDPETSPLCQMEHFITPLSSFFIMPIFAFSNAGISLAGEFEFNSLTFAIIAGLIVGKPIGILLFTFISTKLGVASKPTSLNWNHIFAIGILAGIGFTMSIFIASLTPELASTLDNAKLSILLGSFLAAILGSLYFKIFIFKK